MRFLTKLTVVSKVLNVKYLPFNGNAVSECKKMAMGLYCFRMRKAEFFLIYLDGRRLLLKTYWWGKTDYDRS